MDLKKSTQYEQLRKAQSSGNESPYGTRATNNKSSEPSEYDDVEITVDNITMFEVLLISTILFLVIGIIFILFGDSVNSHEKSTAGLLPPTELSPVASLHTTKLNAIGMLQRVEYLETPEQLNTRRSSVRSVTNITRPQIFASLVYLDSGKSVVIEAVIPDFARGATVYAELTEDGLLSQYCVSKPIERCYKPGFIAEAAQVTPPNQ